MMQGANDGPGTSRRAVITRALKAGIYVAPAIAGVARAAPVVALSPPPPPTVSFAPAVTYPLSGTPFGVAVGDFNGDRILDLALPLSHGTSDPPTVAVLLGRGDGTFRPALESPSGSGYLSPVAADLNGDGRLDLVLVDPNELGPAGAVIVLLGKGDGTFQPPVRYAVGYGPLSVTIGDFNRDGKPDIAVTNEGDSTVSVLLGRGDGTFLPRQDFAVAEFPLEIVVGDFNGDGRLDIAATAFGPSSGGVVSVLLGRGDGTFAPRVDYAGGQGARGLTAGDFNGDGRPDIAVANFTNPSTVAVLLNRGDGSFLPPVKYPVLPTPFTVATGDFNRDGRLDLVTPDASILVGRGDGTFAPRVDIPIAGGPRAVGIGDFNGDGKPDLAIANFSAERVTILINTTGT